MWQWESEIMCVYQQVLFGKNESMWIVEKKWQRKNLSAPESARHVINHGS